MQIPHRASPLRQVIATLYQGIVLFGLSFCCSPLCSSAPDLNLPASLTSDVKDTNTPTATTNTPEYVVIKPSEEVTYSSETAASIAKLNVREGSKFKKGDVLLQMDCRLQQSDLAKALAQSKTATMADRSAKKLKSYGFISDLELSKANSDDAIAAAEVNKLRAVVDKCIIIAPFNGSVADITVHALESVKPGDPLMKIINTGNLEFEIQVPSMWLSWLKVGSQFSVHIHETNKTVPINVVRIDPEIESISRTIKVIGVLAKPDPELLPGMTGQAIFSDKNLSAQEN